MIKYYTLNEICDNLHISRNYMMRLIKSGQVKVIKPSKCYLISDFEYIKLTKAMEVNNER